MARRPGLPFWVMAAACPLLLTFTTHKLYEMARLRGWVGQVRVERQTVRSMAQTGGQHRPTCWVAWTGTDATVHGPHRANMECDHWATLKLGDQIDVLYLPTEDGDGDAPYLRATAASMRRTATSRSICSSSLSSSAVASISWCA